jgi:hypothetical protein
MTTARRRATLVVLLPIASLSYAQAPVRHLPVVDEMPPAPLTTLPAGDVVAFFPKAPSALESGPALRLYGIECSVPIVTPDGKGYFTLAMRNDKREALFVLTEGPVTSLEKILSFGDESKTQDWGFLYDRNGDGWADYIAFLLGAMPVGTPEVLAHVPRRPMPKVSSEGTSKYTITREEFALRAANARLVFIHYVDDDFDGKTDAIVSALQDPDHYGWIYRRAVLRSSDHSQTTDEDWVFLRDIAAREGPIPREPDGRFVRLEGLGDVREKHLEHFAEMFDLVNSGLRGCRVPRGILPRG